MTILATVLAETPGQGLRQPVSAALAGYDKEVKMVEIACIGWKRKYSSKVL